MMLSFFVILEDHGRAKEMVRIPKECSVPSDENGLHEWVPVPETSFLSEGSSKVTSQSKKDFFDP